MVKKIVITGPESSGKTTLAKQLATALNTAWVPEYARTYLEQLERPYVENDLLAIAKGQLQAEADAIQNATNYLICDTDLLTLKIWSEIKYNRCAPFILDHIKQTKDELYLLCLPDIPWEYDPLREHPEDRDYLFAYYKKELLYYQKRFFEIGGSEAARLQEALRLLKDQSASSSTINESLHRTEYLKQGDFFLKQGSPCTKIGKLLRGVLRGFVYDKDGNEITSHFYQEGDMIVASYLPKVNISMSIQALEDCEISVANYSEVMAQVNKNQEITDVINRDFQQLNQQWQSRLVSLLNLSALEKYKAFLENYPGLLNRIPHYYIAQYLGITPTQLSRVRKQFINKCK